MNSPLSYAIIPPYEKVLTTFTEYVKKQIDRGVTIGAGRREDSAEVGRKYTKRKMP